GKLGMAMEIAFEPGNESHIWVAHSSTVMASTDGGATWKNQVDGLQLTTNRDVEVDPLDARRVYVANADNQSFHCSSNKGYEVNNVPIGAGYGASLIALDSLDGEAQSTVFVTTNSGSAATDDEVFQYDGDPCQADGKWVATGYNYTGDTQAGLTHNLTPTRN